MPFVVEMTRSQEFDYPVIAERINIPEGTNISWNTVIEFSDEIGCFVMIDRRYLRLISGHTIIESYEISTGKRLGIFQRPRNPEFVIYAYRRVITECAVGGRFPFVDLEDGVRKEVATFWHFTLKAEKPEELVKEAAIAENGKITSVYCILALREKANLNGIIEQVISSKLREVPFIEIRTKLVEISNEIINIFHENGGVEHIGFDIESCTLGDIRIAE